MKEKTLVKLDHLDKKLQLLLEKLATIPLEKLKKQPPAGGWSAIQVMQHVFSVENSSLQYLQKKVSFNPELKKAGLLAWWRITKFKIAYNLPLKFKAPKIVDPTLQEASPSFWEISKQWKETRSTLRKFLVDANPDLFEKELYKHPLVGKMSLFNMLEFFDGHFKRHEKQLWRVLGGEGVGDRR